MKVRTLASLILLTLATDAGAHLYKYVNPDGSVIYSDRPPANPMPHVQVFSAGVPRAVGAAEPGYFAVPKPEPAEAPLRRPPSGPAAAPAAPASPPPDAALQQLAALLPGLRVAMNETTLIDRSVDLCILTLPRSFRTYVGAQDAWKVRNAAVTEHMNAVLSNLVSGDERLRMDQAALEYTSARLQPVRALPAAKRIEWCDRTAGAIGSGKSDLAGMAAMRTLLQFQPR